MKLYINSNISKIPDGNGKSRQLVTSNVSRKGLAGNIAPDGGPKDGDPESVIYVNEDHNCITSSPRV